MRTKLLGLLAIFSLAELAYADNRDWMMAETACEQPFATAGASLTDQYQQLPDEDNTHNYPPRESSNADASAAESAPSTFIDHMFLMGPHRNYLMGRPAPAPAATPATEEEPIQQPEPRRGPNPDITRDETIEGMYPK